MVGLGDLNAPAECKYSNYSKFKRKTFQPYWRCSHGCVYCYAKYGYRWTYWAERSKTMVAVSLRQVSKDFSSLHPYRQIEASSSCDPFDLKYEPKYRITKKALESIFGLRKDILFTWITKSHIIGEYIDLLPKLSIPQITIESVRSEISSPNASKYEQRLEAISVLANAGVPVGVRIDPIIPDWITMEEIFGIIDAVANLGCKHVTISVLKVQEEQIEMLEKYFKIDIRNKTILNPMNRLYYFNEDIRKEIELPIKEKCDELGITFATCMENVVSDTGYCDPFHLINCNKD